jgi:hypothetical protein
MGTRRRRQRQEELWYRGDLAEAPGHSFYRRLNEVLENISRHLHSYRGRVRLRPALLQRPFSQIQK